MSIDFKQFDKTDCIASSIIYNRQKCSLAFMSLLVKCFQMDDGSVYYGQLTYMDPEGNLVRALAYP